MATYDLKYPGAAIDAILDTAYDLQNAGYIFRGLASEYSNTPTERSWVLAGEGETGHGFTSPIPKGYIGVCVFDGTSWTGKLLKCVSIDSTPTNGSTNALSSGGAYASINNLATFIDEALDNLTFTDTTPSAFLGNYIKMKVSTTDGGIERIMTYFTILAATAEKAGLLSAADKQKLDAMLGNLRSLEIDDTTAYADLGTKIVESIKATIGGTEETISTFQILGATASKAGLLSAADKAKLDALWSSGYQFAGIATPSTTPVSTTSKIFYIATEAGTYFNAVTVTQGINILSWDGSTWSAVQVIGIDDEPTSGSGKLVESGGAYNMIHEDNGFSRIQSAAPQGVDTYFRFDEFKVVAGTKYYVRYVSGYLYNFATSIEDAVHLSEDHSWVEFTADTTAYPYTYTGDNEGKTPTVVDIAKADGIIIEILQTDEHLGMLDKKASTFFDLFSTYSTESLGVINDYSEAVKSLRVYGGKEKYTYCMKRIGRNVTNQYFSNQYIFWFVAFNNATGNSFEFYKRMYLHDRELSEGTLLNVTLYDFSIQGTPTESDYSFPSSIHVTVDYSAIPDGEEIGTNNTLAILNDCIFIQDEPEAFKKEILNQVNYIPLLDFADEPTIYHPSGSGLTVTDKGYIVEEGHSSTVFFGFRISDSTKDAAKSLAGKTVRARFLSKFGGTDYDKVSIVIPVINLYENDSKDVGTFTDLQAHWVNEYYIVEWLWAFPASMPESYTANVYIRFKTESCSYPVSVDYCGVYYAYIASDTPLDMLLTNGLTNAIHKIAANEVNAGSGKTTVINVSRDGTSRTGRQISYSGLTAISDALDSISDASPSNRYTIHVEGVFKFTDPMTVPMYGGGEYSIILMKDYVDIEGDGPDKSAIIVDFPAGLDDDQSKPVHFHSGKQYSDYQPIYFYGVGGSIRDMKIVGRNCRYAFHIEHGEGDAGSNKTIDVDNCYVEYSRPDYSGSYGNAFGTGITSGQTWNIRNCNVIYHGGGAFAMHTPLGVFRTPPHVNLVNCKFNGPLVFHNYQVENNTFVSIVGCGFGGKVPLVNYAFYNNRTVSRHGFYTTILTEANGTDAYYNVPAAINSTTSFIGAVLRIVSATTGLASAVRFDKESSAFASIITDEQDASPSLTAYMWDTLDGYVIRDGGVGIQGQAFGILDIDESGSNNVSLGKLLGDCSSTSKELVVNVDGVDYTVTFDEDYSLQPNSYVISKINAVLGEAATADVFCPAKLYYPNINGLQLSLCKDSGSILRGMGVVRTSAGIRRAKNTDGYIDGIALDDMAENQYGRIITSGWMSCQIYRTQTLALHWFTTLDDVPSFNVNTPVGLGISPSEDGVFKQGEEPYVLRKDYSPVNSGWPILKILR